MMKSEVAAHRMFVCACVLSEYRLRAFQANEIVLRLNMLGE